MPYDGFISYSHASDARLAPALQQGLQRLAKPWNSRRALHIFRDESGLSTNPDLWLSIERAMADSEWFVLLASPDAARSEWVNKEVSRWLATKSADRILAVVTDGTWEWDAVGGDLRTGSTAVPPALQGVFRNEPRSLDLRWARTATDLDLRNTRFRSAVADLAAPMHGVAKDELEGEDIRQHRRARRLARGGVATLALLLVISVIISLFAIVQRNDARAATDAAEQRLLVNESQSLLTTNRTLATLLAIEADRRQPSATTRDALMNTVLAQPSLQRSLGDVFSYAVAGLSGNRFAVLAEIAKKGATTSALEVWNWKTGRQQSWPGAPTGSGTTGPVNISSPADGSELDVIFGDGAIRCYSGLTLLPEGPAFASGLSRRPKQAVGANIVVSSNGQTLVASEYASGSAVPGGTVRVFSHVSGRWDPDPVPDGDATWGTAIAVSPDGREMAASYTTPSGSHVVVTDALTGRALAESPTVGPAFSIALDWAHRRVVVATPSGQSGDALAYDVSSPDPTPQALTVGPAAGTGDATVAYDTGGDRLAVNSSNGLEVFDASTLKPIADAPVLPPDGGPGPFLFLDSVHILTTEGATAQPMDVWDLTSTSVLASRVPTTFTGGIYPFAAGTHTDEFIGVSTLHDERSVTILGEHGQPLGPPLVVDSDLSALPGAVQQGIESALPPPVCADPRSGRIATVSVATGDVVIRSGTPPFRVLSDAHQVVRGMPDPISCTWSPDGREIAIGNYPNGTGQVAAASLALFDVATGQLRFDVLVHTESAILSIFFDDSKSLWIGGPTYETNGVYRVTGLTSAPTITAAFPGAGAIAPEAGGRNVVVAYNTSVQVADRITRTPIGPSIAVGGQVIIGVDVSPDGSTAVVDSQEGWRLVDLAAHQAVGPWIPDPFPSRALLAGNDTTVFSLAADGGGERWDLSPDRLRSAACSLAGRNLTASEWQSYLSWSGPRRATCPQYSLPQN